MSEKQNTIMNDRMGPVWSGTFIDPETADQIKFFGSWFQLIQQNLFFHHKYTASRLPKLLIPYFSSVSSHIFFTCVPINAAPVPVTIIKPVGPVKYPLTRHNSTMMNVKNSICPVNRGFVYPGQSY